MSAATEMAPRVLVVEDDAAIAELVRYNLEAEGLRSTIAATGEEAELQVAEDRFDLIVLDWMLPGLSGIELCRRLRRRDDPAQRADPDADRARRGRRPRARPRHRRRRLRGEAVLGAGAGGAREGAAAPGGAEPRRRHPARRRHRAQPHRAPRHPPRARGPPGPHRVQAARLLHGEHRAASCRASSCSTACGGAMPSSTGAPSMCTSGGSGRR